MTDSKKPLGVPVMWNPALDENEAPPSGVLPPTSDDSEHWLVRPDTVRMLWAIFIAILLLTVLADLFVEHHPHFGIDGTFGFGAWYGFAACVVLVVGAKAIGLLLKKPDTYYDN